MKPMKKIILIPDSFKGTMSSTQICSILEERIKYHYPQASVISIPVADGGEGSVDCFISAMGGERVFLKVMGPYMDEMEGFFGVVDNGATAVIEMAACAGLPLVGDNLHPGKTTTFGVGQMIAEAVKRRCKKIIVGLGGSATNDFGAGAAAALGVQFMDKDGNYFIPVGESLDRIARIDMSGLLPGLKETQIITMCDIDNPLYGKTGAAYVFSPQKGADPAIVEALDRGLRAVSETVKRELGVDVARLPGAGAAGGMGGGMVAFLNSRLTMGIEAVLDTVGFDELIEGADLIISGEGRIDSQSLRGKVVVGVARRAKRRGISVIALVGDIVDPIEAVYSEGVSAIFSINRVAVPFNEAKKRSKEDLMLTADNLMRLFKVLGYEQS